MLIDEIRDTMEYIEEITQELGDALTKDAYYIEDLGCPHKPSALPKGYMGIYIFVHETDLKCEFFKIGKANANSAARFNSQNYGFNAGSTLAKSICGDEEFSLSGIDRGNVKEWMMDNLHRINVLIRAEQGKAATELVETIFHYKFRPRYEGSI